MWPFFFLPLSLFAQHLQQLPKDRFLAAFFVGDQAQGEPLLVRQDQAINFDWGSAAPDPAIPQDGFSAHWLGRFRFERGLYQFETSARGGVQLYINGELSLDTWQATATQSTNFIPISGGWQVIELRYRHQTGDAAVALSWQQDSLADTCEPVPNTFCVNFFDSLDTNTSPVITRRDAKIRGAWGLGSPHVSLPEDGFAVTWAGNIGFTAATYRFSGRFNGDLSISLDGTEVFSASDQGGEPQSFAFEVDTQAGLRNFVVTYRHISGDADLAVSWQAINKDHDLASVGINIHQLTYWSPEWTLLDTFKASGGWFTQTILDFDTFEQDRLDLDASGWVRSLPTADSDAQYRYVAALLLNGNGAKHPAGRYVVTYEGEGEIEYYFDAVKIERLSRPGRDVIEIAQPTNGGILLRISETDPRGVGNYIRNIRVIMPGYRCAGDPFSWVEEAVDCPGGATSAEPFAEIEAQQPFHPALLQNLRQYKAVRHMDFLATNGTIVSSWESRTQRSDARYLFDKGAPPELMIQMAEFLGSDVWVNIPAEATDAYVTNLAALALERLAPHQRVILEYSNEVWNLIFPQGNWVQTQGIAAWPNDPTDPYFKRINWYGKRTNEVIGLWKGVWGDQASRVLGVMGGQLSNETIARVALDCPLWAAENGGQNCTSNIDAITMAPYFGGYLGNAEFYDQVTAWIAEGEEVALHRLFNDLTQGGLLPDGESGLGQAIGWMQDSKNTADAYGLKLVAYEGGQHLVGVGGLINDDQLTALFNAANRDGRMYDLYTRYLNAWREVGGDLFCLWKSMSSFDRFGNWGIQESMDDTDNPKYVAVQDFLRDTPCWWENCEAFSP
jgi:hypothetical protein